MSDEPNKVSDADPEVSSEQDTPSSEALRKNRAKKGWLVPLIVLLLLAVVAAATYFIYWAPSQESAKKAKDETAAATHFASAEDLVDATKPKFKGTLVDIVTIDGLGGKTATGYGAYGVAPYKVDDRKFENYPTTTDGTSYKSDSVVASQNYDKLVNFFEKNKFKLLNSGKDKTGPIAWQTDDVRYISYATYESSNLVCMIWHVDASGTPIGQHATSVGCGEKSSYSAAAKELDQYYTAYSKGAADSSTQIIFGAPRTGDSNISGYKVAVVYQENPTATDSQFDGLYYKTPGQKEWTYFKASYGWLDCPDFNTDALKKAFDGFNCYDKASDTVINVGTGTLAPKLTS